MERELMNPGKVTKSYSEKAGSFKINIKNHTSLIGLLIVLIIATILSPSFLTPINIFNLAIQVSAPGILAIGMTFVILTAGIDLSVGSLLALTGVIVALSAPSTGWEAGVLAALAVGTVVGIFHGITITKLKVPPFIVTLAGLTAYKGLALVVTGSSSIPINSEAFAYLGSGRISPTLAFSIMFLVAAIILFRFIKGFNVYSSTEKTRKSISLILSFVGLSVFSYLIYTTGGLPVQVFIFITIFAIAWFVLNKTVFGREIFAIGGNIEGARLAGIKVNRNLVIVYASLGFLTAISGVLTTARLGSGSPQIGSLGELDAIAAVIIGGTSFAGGMGTLGGTIIGVILIGVINNILSLLNVTTNMQMIVKGVIILGAVILDARLRKK